MTYKYHSRIGSESKAKYKVEIKITHFNSIINLNQSIITPLVCKYKCLQNNCRLIKCNIKFVDCILLAVGNWQKLNVMSYVECYMLH